MAPNTALHTNVETCLFWQTPEHCLRTSSLSCSSAQSMRMHNLTLFRQSSALRRTSLNCVLQVAGRTIVGSAANS